eukprot:c7095_g1_i1.p1 GENE.c7095_g1_i1~~c7095_g1_i1.p1  ORF type:complete len:262 (+),score=81.21 c7095_g1_i1:45-830(+)
MEATLCRLLRRCENQFTELSDTRPHIRTHFVREMFSQLKNLQESCSPEDNETKQRLNSYQNRIRYLADVANRIENNAEVATAPVYNAKHMSHQQKIQELHVRIEAKNKLEEAQRRALLEVTSAPLPEPSTAREQSDREKLGLREHTEENQIEEDSTTFEMKMLRERQRQEAESAELLLMTQALKAQYEAAHQAILKDVKTLDDIDRAASRNSQQLATENTRLNQQLKEANTTFWLSWLILILVAIMSSGTFLAIKIFPKGQ